MSNLTLRIGGRSFVVACAPGEESHVTGLASTIDTKLSALGDISGQGEARMLLFAALLLADELHERDAPKPEDEAPLVEALAEEIVHPTEDVVAERLDAIAERLENIAASLERAVADA